MTRPIILTGDKGTEKEKRKIAKDPSGSTNIRKIYTQETAAIVAKNRFGLSPEITLNDDPQSAINLFSKLQ